MSLLAPVNLTSIALFTRIRNHFILAVFCNVLCLCVLSGQSIQYASDDSGKFSNYSDELQIYVQVTYSRYSQSKVNKFHFL